LKTINLKTKVTRDDFYKSLDPRTKVIVFFGLLSLVFIVKDIYWFSGLIMITLLLVFFKKKGGVFLKMLIRFIPVLLVAFVLWSLFYNWSIFHINSSNNFNVNLGIFMTFRLFTLISISLAFILIVKPEELIRALELLRLPYTLAFTLGLALRHISTMSDEYRAIKEAQISRGLELDSGFILKRIKNYTYVLIPLLIRTIETAEKLTLAMELKAIMLRKNRHKIGYKLSVIDYILIALTIIVVGFSIIHYIFGGVLL